MKSFISKLLGNKEKAVTKSEPIQEDITDKIITEVDQPPLGVSESNVLYGGPNELGGFHLLNTAVVGTFRIKTKKGVSLTINGLDYTMELASDMLEIESDFSNVPNRYVSNIDFHLEKDQLDLIKRSTIEEFILKSEKEEINFKIYRIPENQVTNAEEE
ncbi:hypothetical protein SAMN03097699_0196 [Flavobacteriaceae bacterium MAR_2010_188]|nr:hypothetical protein SAMN03097699_0196 [Flavobacteriaceae bacterium MAR_2010_188]